jgi:hypothetical protein
MNGFRAFKYYTAIKLHFTNPKFDVFVNRGRVKGTLDRFLMRNDRMLFERLAKDYPVDKDCIQYIASNFMYGNQNVVYDSSTSVTNYKEFIRRRQSITHVFTNDLDTIVKSGAQYTFGGSKIPDVLQLYLSNRITLETMVILDQLDGILGKLRENSQISLLLDQDLLRIEKSQGFVKYDSYKVMSPYLSFLEDIQGTANG